MIMSNTVICSIQRVQCYGNLDVISGSGIISCPYCGARNVLSENARKIVADDSHVFMVKLYQAIASSFCSVAELTELILLTSAEIRDSSLSYENIGGSTVSGKSLELVMWIKRRGFLQELVDVALSLRPRMEI
jgi:hypothetical protein